MLKPLKITVSQFDMLANLYVEDGVSQQTLAERLLVTKGNVTGLINRLFKAGLVVRRDSKEDKRVNRIFLTRKGRNVAKRGLVVQRCVIEQMLGELNGCEQKDLRSLLDRVAHGLG